MAKTHRILVVDDEAGIRNLFTRVLKHDFEVLTAGSGEEALDIIPEASPSTIILDIRMPGIDGIATLQRIKKQWPSIPVIMLTAHQTVASAVMAMKSGAYDYLTKPFDVDEMKAIISNALEVHSLRTEVRKLREEIREKYSFDQLVGKSKAMQEVYDLIPVVASSRSTVLITGESGTGKELVARAIHYHSPRYNSTFIKVNCAALSAGIIESELFGHEKGSFTGAHSSRQGRFELADGGTILLDEISEMNAELQAKLLRVLQEGEFERVGGSKTFKVDVRVLATTNRNLPEYIAEGKFREDLYYRLNVVPIHLPPLRERTEDVPLLVEHFFRKYAEQNSREIKWPDHDLLSTVDTMDWQGNVRELENFVERYIVIGQKGLEKKDAVIHKSGGNGDSMDDGLTFKPGTSIREMEKRLILETLDHVGGDKQKAVDMLGISIRTLRNKLNQYKDD